VEQKSKNFVKPAKIDFEPRSRSRGKSGTAKTFHIKRTVKEEERWVRFIGKNIKLLIFVYYSYIFQLQ
jgi:hypothetical protein